MQIENTGSFIVSGGAPGMEKKQPPQKAAAKRERVRKTAHRAARGKFFAEYAASLRDGGHSGGGDGPRGLLHGRR